MVSRIKVFEIGLAIGNSGKGFFVPLSFMSASHIGFYFLLYFTTGSSSLCSLLDLVLPLSVCFSMESKQVDCEPDIESL